MIAVTPQEQLIQKIARFRWDPLGFARRAFPWKQDELADSSGPRPWQSNVLDLVGKHLSDPETRFKPCQIAVSSGHGIGKSCLVSILTLWAMSTCPDCKVIITSNTEAQLRTKTWPELAKWFRLSINAHWFNFGATSVTSRAQGHERLWRCDQSPWSDNNTEAFAGLHNKGNRILVIFDEASSISDKIYEVAEGALTDEKTEIIWLCFGNPTRNEGRFFECFGRLKHRWKTLQIDSRQVEGTNKEKIAEWIADYGEDSDFCRIRIKGEFPRAGSTQLISSEAVAACRRYKAMGYESLPKILSCDVARFGDDQTVIGLRQGRKFDVLAKLRGLDTVQVSHRLSAFMEQHSPQETVVDADGLGAGVVDNLRSRGYSCTEFHGGVRPQNPAKYFNLRAECWGLMNEALKAGMEIPDDPELAADLTGPQYGFSPKNQIQLEKKSDLKSRGLASPDLGDCLAMSYSVTPRLPRPEKPVYTYTEFPGCGDRWAWMK